MGDTSAVFERFTDDARRVVVIAQEEARLLDHNWIGTEHLLLAVIHQGGVVAEALEPFGLTLDRVRAEVEPPDDPAGCPRRPHPVHPRRQEDDGAWRCGRR